VVVVDPGVGSDRKILYLVWKVWRFLAPDNGVLSPLLLEPEFIHELREVTQSDLFLVKRGNTFDGRDRFAPVAAQLARGFSPSDLGPDLPGPVIIKDLLTKARFRGNSITGQVAYVDSFGNLITTIEESDVARLKSSSESGSGIVASGFRN
jgi:S-adenosylmethionine hydrolase